MRKKVKKIIWVIFLIGFIVYYFFFDLQRISGEKKISESISPDGKYTVVAYLNNGGATTDYSVLGVCINNVTQQQKNIYWKYHDCEAEIYWENEIIININGISLDVTKDVYDWRHTENSM